MFDTMTMTKVVGGFCGAFLIFLLGGWVSEIIYHEPVSHDGEHHQAYTIDTGDDGHGAEEVEEVPFADIYAAADAASGEKLFRQCQACHKVDNGANGTGPHLFGVVGRGVGSVGDYSYSGDMAAFGGAWTPELLNDFIASPKGLISGTKMSYKGMPKAEDRANLIAWLATQG